MSTRGFVGFVVDGVEKIQYVHSDAYPGGVGEDVLSWLRGVAKNDALDAVVAQARALRVVTYGTRATPDDVARLATYADYAVGSGERNDWYCLLRGTQGYLDLVLEAGVVEDASEFPLNSASAEWGYLVNLDDREFEVYRGCQYEAHRSGRFALRRPSRNPRGARPVRLAASWPLANLPDVAEFLAALRPASNENEENEEVGE